MNKVHSFHSSLKKGKEAETKFLKLFEDKIEQLDGTHGDFRIKSNNKVIELKTDFYDPNGTPNFFMERFSYDNKPGGVWQAKEHGASYYVYIFAMDPNKIYVFDVDQLLAELQRIENTLRCINIKNIRHTTVGYLVPRTLLTHLQLNMEDIL